MNAGLANLTTLKRHLLAERLRPEIQFDDEIAAIGLGVAAGMERYCDRRFGYQSGDTWETAAADRTTFVLPRYPVASLTSIHLRSSHGSPWELQDPNDLLLQLIAEAGVVTLDTAIGWRGSTIRFTWSGGYWFDTTEDASGTQPVGATVLPDDLRHAWLLQCQDIWSRRDNLGVGLTSKPGERSKISELDMSASVGSLLRPFIRHG